MDDRLLKINFEKMVMGYQNFKRLVPFRVTALEIQTDFFEIATFVGQKWSNNSGEGKKAIELFVFEES